MRRHSSSSGFKGQRMTNEARSVWSKMWLKKPKDVVMAESTVEKLHRHYTLTDLLALGIGGTVGSGVFVLSGLIATDYAGPGVILSWIVAGVGCVLSGLAYAELASRIPSAGSSYAYTYYALGELPAFIAAWCLTLEYGLSASAVARAWGDKVVNWWEGLGLTVWSVFNPGHGINVFAGIMQLLCTGIILAGLEMGKATVNFFTITKMLLVIFMIIIGFSLYKPENLSPFLPKGSGGILRGATSAFFGYLGYDEVCCLAGEAKDPARNLPLSVGGTIIGVTILYVLSAWGLVATMPYDKIDPDSGFSEAFKDRDWGWAGQIVAAGEVLTLPLVVLVSFLAQPRLQFAMAEDGLLPKVFSEVDDKGNLRKGALISGIVCTIIAVFVPFHYLDDMISAGVLLSFNLSNTSLLVIRREHPESPMRLKYLLVAFNVVCFITAFLWTYIDMESPLITFPVIFTVAAIGIAAVIDQTCPEKSTTERESLADGSALHFTVPYLPWIPCAGILVNYVLVAQLEWYGVLAIFGYIGLAIAVYFLYGIHNSVGNNTYWRTILRDSAVSRERATAQLHSKLLAEARFSESSDGQ